MNYIFNIADLKTDVNQINLFSPVVEPR